MLSVLFFCFVFGCGNHIKPNIYHIEDIKTQMNLLQFNFMLKQRATVNLVKTWHINDDMGTRANKWILYIQPIDSYQDCDFPPSSEKTQNLGESLGCGYLVAWTDLNIVYPMRHMLILCFDYVFNCAKVLTTASRACNNYTYPHKLSLPVLWSLDI